MLGPGPSFDDGAWVPESSPDRHISGFQQRTRAGHPPMTLDCGTANIAKTCGSVSPHPTVCLGKHPAAIKRVKAGSKVTMQGSDSRGSRNQKPQNTLEILLDGPKNIGLHSGHSRSICRSLHSRSIRDAIPPGMSQSSKACQ